MTLLRLPNGLETQVELGVEDGLKHDRAVYCDALISLPKSKLTDYAGSLPFAKMEAVNAALRIAFGYRVTPNQVTFPRSP